MNWPEVHSKCRLKSWTEKHTWLDTNAKNVTLTSPLTRKQLLVKNHTKKKSTLISASFDRVEMSVSKT